MLKPASLGGISFLFCQGSFSLVAFGGWSCFKITLHGFQEHMSQHCAANLSGMDLPGELEFGLVCPSGRMVSWRWYQPRLHFREDFSVSEAFSVSLQKPHFVCASFFSLTCLYMTSCRCGQQGYG